MREPRTIGLLGGMSWRSSIEYERIINSEVHAALGGVHSASLLLCAYDFAVIEQLQTEAAWEQAGALLAADALRLQERRGLSVVIPTEPDRGMVHDVIYDELVQGIVSPASKARYLEAIERLGARGAQGVIAGCTEIELLVGPDDVDLPYFPTTRLHAQAAARWALAGPEGA